MPSTSTASDTRLRTLAENVSRQLDRHLNRRVHSYVGTFYYGGDGSTSLIVQDLVAVTSLKEDDNNDGTFNSSWAAADYVLTPFNADPTSEFRATPYTVILVRQASTGTQDVFLRGQRNYEIVGTWGYSHVTARVATASASFDSTATSIPINASASTGAEVGWTVLVDSEQMYVTGKTTSGTSFTVTRAVNGSTAATHASGAAISRYIYPEPVAEAALMQCARLVKRAQAGFVSQAGLPETGEIQIFTQGPLDSDVRAMIAPYRRLSI